MNLFELIYNEFMKSKYLIGVKISFIWIINSFKQIIILNSLKIIQRSLNIVFNFKTFLWILVKNSLLLI
jgi:hypothetical protein